MPTLYRLLIEVANGRAREALGTNTLPAVLLISPIEGVEIALNVPLGDQSKKSLGLAPLKRSQRIISYAPPSAKIMWPAHCECEAGRHRGGSATRRLMAVRRET
jgi:hypothetical protein